MFIAKPGFGCMETKVIERCTNNFSGRIASARSFEEYVRNELIKRGFCRWCIKNGVECYPKDVHNDLRSMSDPTSYFFRYKADYFACLIPSYDDPYSSYIEVKNSVLIEKDAWEQYIKLACADNSVVLVFRDVKSNPDSYSGFCGFIKDIELYDTNDPASGYSERKYTVIDGWACPRETPEWVNSETRNGSGTPFKKININSSRLFIFPDEFQALIDLGAANEYHASLRFSRPAFTKTHTKNKRQKIGCVTIPMFLA